MSAVDATEVAGRGIRLRRTRGLGPLGAVSIAVIAVAAAIAVVGPWIAPHDPTASQLSNAYVGPTGDHPLGFDGQGSDLLSRLLVGARTSLLGPLCVVALAMAVGTTLALVSAWRGGALDTAIASGMNVLFAFPAILMAILAAAMFGSGLVAASIALAIAYTPYIALVVRAAARRERAQPYVAALEVQGVSAFAICVRHLIPNVMPLIVAQGTLLFGYAMVDLAAISFVGLGIQPPDADWGLMVSAGKSGLIEGYPAESLAAGFCIVATAVAFNIVGERLADRAERRA